MRYKQGHTTDPDFIMNTLDPLPTHEYLRRTLHERELDTYPVFA